MGDKNPGCSECGDTARAIMTEQTDTRYNTTPSKSPAPPPSKPPRVPTEQQQDGRQATAKVAAAERSPSPDTARVLRIRGILDRHSVGVHNDTMGLKVFSHTLCASGSACVGGGGGDGKRPRPPPPAATASHRTPIDAPRSSDSCHIGGFGTSSRGDGGDGVHSVCVPCMRWEQDMTRTNSGGGGDNRRAPTSCQRMRRSSSCPTRRSGQFAKSARLTKEQRSVGRDDGGGGGGGSECGSSSGGSVRGSNLRFLMESAVDNLSGVIGEFQQGIRAVEYEDGDLAAKNGHLHIAKNVAVRFTLEAMTLAASRGHLEMLVFLHETRKEGTTVDAMDMGATFGHLEVVRFLHLNRTEGCTTRAMDGAARNAHINVRFSYHLVCFGLDGVINSMAFFIQVALAIAHPGVRLLCHVRPLRNHVASTNRQENNNAILGPLQHDTVPFAAVPYIARYSTVTQSLGAPDHVHQAGLTSEAVDGHRFRDQICLRNEKIAHMLVHVLFY